MPAKPKESINVEEAKELELSAEEKLRIDEEVKRTLVADYFAKSMQTHAGRLNGHLEANGVTTPPAGTQDAPVETMCRRCHIWGAHASNCPEGGSSSSSSSSASSSSSSSSPSSSSPVTPPTPAPTSERALLASVLQQFNARMDRVEAKQEVPARPVVFKWGTTAKLADTVQAILAFIDGAVASEELARLRAVAVAILEGVIRSDTDRTTTKAVPLMLAAVKKVLKGHPSKDKVLQLLAWEEFTERAREKRKPEEPPPRPIQQAPVPVDMLALMKNAFQPVETKTEAQRMGEYMMSFMQASSPSASSAATPRPPQPQCTECKKYGHTRANCFDLHPDKRDEYNARMSRK